MPSNVSSESTANTRSPYRYKFINVNYNAAAQFFFGASMKMFKKPKKGCDL